MNTEDFVTYEQALALKKLGYREPCLYYYINRTLHPNNVYAHRVDRSSFHRVYSVEALSKVRNVAKEQIVCDAPTLAQVQKWLEKEKGMAICPCPSAKFVRNTESFKDCKWVYTGWIWQAFIIGTDKVLSNGPEDKGTLYSSSEEALSAGITECLKFLEKKD